MRIVPSLFALVFAAVPAFAEDGLPEGALRRFGSPDGAHGEEIVDAAFSADGTRLLTLGAAALRAWDVPSLRPRYSVELETEGTFLALSADGALAGIGQENGVFLFHVADGTPAGRMYGPPASLVFGAFSPDGKRFAATDEEGDLRIWDVATRSYVAGDAPGDSKPLPSGLAWSGDRVVTWDEDGDVRVSDGASGKDLRTFRTGADGTDGGAVSPDGKTLALAVDGGGVRAWSLETGEEAEAPVGEEAELATGLAWSPDGSCLAWGDYEDRLCVWSLADKKARVTVPMRGADAAPAFSRDGKWLAAGAGGYRITLIDAATGKRATEPAGHDGAVQALQFDASGGTLWSAGADGDAWAWDLATGAGKRLFQNGAPLRAVGPLDGGARFITATNEGGLAVWDAATSKRLLQSGNRLGALEDWGWAAGSGKMFVLGQNGHGEIWDGSLGAPLATFDVAMQPGAGAALSPDGRIVALTTGVELSLFDARSGVKLTKQSIGQNGLASPEFSPDGAWVVAGDRNAGEVVFEVATGQAFAVRSAAGPERIAFVGLSRIVCADPKGTLRFVDLAASAEDDPARALPARIVSLAVSPDGRVAATGFADGTVLAWEVPSGSDAGAVAAQPWEKLGGAAEEAFRVIASCARAGPETVKALAAGLARVPDVPSSVRGSLAGLGSDQADARERAEEELKKAGGEAEPAVREAMHGASPEVASRLESVLASCDLPPCKSAELVRRARAIAALERCGSIEAREALGRVASSSPFGSEKRAAEAALKRLGRR